MALRHLLPLRLTSSMDTTLGPPFLLKRLQCISPVGHLDISFGTFNQATTPLLHHAVHASNGTYLSTFTTSAFLMIATFVTNRDPRQASCESQCPLDGILEAFSVLRGMGAIRKVMSQQLQRNLIYDLFGSQPLDLNCESLRLVEIQLRPLQTLVTLDRSLTDGLKNAVCSGIACCSVSWTASTVPYS
jgi:hypothetical protein